LRLLAKNLEQLEKGIKGLVVISPDLEEVLDAMNANLVPKSWNGAYFSMKPLSNWFEDLKQRYEFFNTWALRVSHIISGSVLSLIQLDSPHLFFRDSQEKLRELQSISLNLISYLYQRKLMKSMSIQKMVPSFQASTLKVANGMLKSFAYVRLR